MGGEVCFQTLPLSQEQEIVQMVWVCTVLPSLNANTKNTRLECRTRPRDRLVARALSPLSGPISTQEGGRAETRRRLLGPL